MNFLIRKATNDDLQLLAKMNKKLIIDEGSRNPMTEDQLKERMAGWLLGEWEIEIVTSETDVVGYAVYQYRKDEFYPEKKHIYVRQFFIEREFRGKGYGTEALRCLIEQSFPIGVEITIEVLESNPRGHNFWSKFGFTPYCTTMKLTK